MKKSGLLLIASLLALLLGSTTAFAQGGEPPPPCCPRDAEIVFDKDVPEAQSVEGQVDVAETTLRLLQVTRSQFIDRLSAGLFAGKQVELVLSSTRLVLNRTVRGSNAEMTSERRSSSDQELVAVQEKRFYQMPRNKVRSEDLDAVDQLYLTDGEVYIKVSFSKGQ